MLAQDAVELDPPIMARTLYVSEGYFDTLGVAALQGRLLREIDGAPGSEAVVVNARFASKYYPGENVLGKRIRLKAPTSGPDAQKVKPWTTIVGVTPTVRQRNVQDVEPDAVIYLSYRLDPPSAREPEKSTSASMFESPRGPPRSSIMRSASVRGFS